jgi:hypothetical protein
MKKNTESAKQLPGHPSSFVLHPFEAPAFAHREPLTHG